MCVLIHSAVSSLALALWLTLPPAFLKWSPHNCISELSLLSSAPEYAIGVPAPSTVHSGAQWPFNEYTLSLLVLCSLFVVSSVLCRFMFGLWINAVFLIWGAWPGCVCMFNDWCWWNTDRLSCQCLEYKGDTAMLNVPQRHFITSENTDGGLKEYHLGYMSIRKNDGCWLLFSFLNWKNVLLCFLTVLRAECCFAPQDKM